MNLQQLRYLVATVDAGTMTAAAQQVHVAQPALSRAVHALEEELGVVLFAHATGVDCDSPTPVWTWWSRPGGCWPRSTASSTRPTPIDRSVKHWWWPPRRHSRRCSPDTSCRRTTRSAPTSAVRVHRATGRQEVHELVLAGEAALGLSDLPVADGLQLVVLGQMEIVVLSSADSDVPPSIPLHALDGMRLILPSPGTTRRDEFDALFAAIGVTPVVALESDERSSWMEGMLAGIGSVLWYGERAGAAVERGAKLSRFDPPVEREIGLSFRAGSLDHAGLELVRVATGLGLDLVSPV